jgi:segregation and condensation protein A
MSQVLRHLQGRKFVAFEEWFDPARGTAVLVVTFIALLELGKETLVEIVQAEAFAPIYVRLAFTPAA